VIYQLQRWLGWAAIPNVSLWIVAVQVVFYLALQTPVRGVGAEEMLDRLLLRPDRVLDGEWWRLASFLFLPPLSHPLWAFLAWYAFWLFGSGLETYWGTFRYNLYLWIGWLATVTASLATQLPIQTNAFLSLSVFLAFAALCPEFQIRLYFILPIPIQWLAAVTWLLLLWSASSGDWATRLSILASVGNFVVFFAGEIRTWFRHGLRRMRMDVALRLRPQQPFTHRCTVCGVTDRDDPSREFRYCSQCVGSPCYCSDHLRAHEHLRGDPANSEPSTAARG